MSGQRIGMVVRGLEPPYYAWCMVCDWRSQPMTFVQAYALTCTDSHACLS